VGSSTESVKSMQTEGRTDVVCSRIFLLLHVHKNNVWSIWPFYKKKADISAVTLEVFLVISAIWSKDNGYYISLPCSRLYWRSV
jgi:hypothetical protein